MEHRRSVIIVGGGFAGTSAARALVARLPADVHLTLLSEESYTTFNPLLPEAVGASIFPEQVVAPLRALLMPDGRSRFIMGRVTSMNTAARLLRCSTLGGERELAYDHLVLAFGNRARLDLLPGMAKHALPLKTVGDALEIRNTVLRRLAHIELLQDPDQRRALGHFVVIGGGFSGVEVAGELIDCLGSIRRFYPRVRAEELQVTVLHDGQRLLPALPEGLGAAALRSLRRRGVQVQLGARAQCVHEHGVELSDGTLHLACTVLGTIGTRPNALVMAMGLPTERGRIVVAGDLSVPGHPGVWALGDCAQVPHAQDGKSAPPTAQFAVREGCLLAHNLVRAVNGKDTRDFNHKSRGAMALIGHMKGVAQVFGWPLSGLPAWLLWRAYYLSQMPTMRRKLRIFVEWTWRMVFPTDITHLRFPGSEAVNAAEREGRARATGLPPVRT